MSRSSSRAVVALLAGAVWWSGPTLGGDALEASAARPSRASVYYVSPSGNDAATGTSPTSAWRTLDRATAAALAAGDQLLLSRGAVFAGSLVIAESGSSKAPITVGAYGTGARPVVTGSCVRVDGSRVVVRDLHVDRCTRGGVTIRGDYVTATSLTATGSVAGVEVVAGGDYARVVGNDLRDNTRMWKDTPDVMDDDSGAWGVLVAGDHAEVAHNRISGHVAHSYDYGTDGAAVEIWQAIGTRVHHNRGVDNLAFTELGGARTADTVYRYNEAVSSLSHAHFLVTRGGGLFGPVLGTVAENNTVHLPGEGSLGYYCAPTCSPSVLALRGNIVWSMSRTGYAEGSLASSDNVFWGGPQMEALGSGDVYADPLFTDTAARTLTLRAGSPALDRLAQCVATSDLTGAPCPRDGNGDGVARADTGAYER